MFDPGKPNLDWLGAWILGRALARGLPTPFPDRGGWRAEIGLGDEKRRWLFDALTPAVLKLAREITAPGNNLRVFCESDELRAALPDGWAVGAPSFAMAFSGPVGIAHLPEGFRIDARSDKVDAHVAILTNTGDLAASGHAGIGADAFVYDRIVTQPQFVRRGLGTAVMLTLGKALPNPGIPQILVATEAGLRLYENLGWKVVSPYASANRIG